MPIFTSPVRSTPPIAFLPEDINLQIFNAPIDGRNWQADCQRRNDLLIGVGKGNKACAPFLRQLVAEMSEWRRFVKTEEARQRGEGLTPVLQNWNFPENKGWAPVEEIKSKAFENASFGAEAFAVKIKANRAAWTNCSGPISSWTLRKGPVGLAPKPYNLATRTGQREIAGLATRVSKVATIVHPEHVCQSTVTANSWYQVVRGKAILQSELTAKKKKTLPIGYSPVKKIKKQNVRKGNRATEAQAKPKSEAPICCVPVTGMAKTFAQVVASLRPVVQPHGSKSLWKNPVPDYNAWFNRPGWLKPALKPVFLALEPARGVANVKITISTLKLRGGADNTTPKSDNASAASKEAQHHYLLGLFRQVPDNRESAFAALRAKFANTIVHHSTYASWWKKFGNGNFVLSQRGRPSALGFSVTPSTQDTPKIKRRGTDRQLTKPHDAPQTPADLKSPSAKLHFFADDLTGMVTPQTQSVGIEQQQAPDVGLDSYEDATDQNAYTDAAQQDLADSLGINKTESQASSTRTGKGQFKKADKCVFCNSNVTEEEGYALLNCGHKAHFDKAYYDCYVVMANKSCKHPKCKQKKKNMRCQECHKLLGHGIFETGCYCSTTVPQIHADELETKLKQNNGMCPECSARHPGYCVLCEKMFSLQLDGTRQSRVYLLCCETFLHLECWYSPDPKAACPFNCGKPWRGIKDLHYHRICNVDSPAALPTIGTLRPIIGGRPTTEDRQQRLSSAASIATDQTLEEAASEVSESVTQALLDSELMPPPSLAPRRSSRVRRPSSVTSSGTTPVSRKPQTPVTTQCATPHSSHMGFGCASAKANHLPQYYNSLVKGTQLCPHCNALLLPSEATGPAAYAKCCAKGRVNMMSRYNAHLARPAELTNILNNPAVQYERWRASLYQHVLAYNNNLAFGHINISRSKDVDVRRIVKCNNLINYILWDYNAPNANMPRLHGQLFTIPPEEARPRLDEIAQEKELDPDLLDALLRILRENHPLAVTYQSAAETYQQLPPEDRLNLRMLLVDTNKQGEERTISDQVAQPPALHFADRANVQQIHPGRLSVETVAGSRLVAQFYLDSGANVMPPSVYDVVFMGRNDTKMVQMKWWNRQIDPALFPLLFPCGQFGYEYGIKLTLREKEAFDSAYKQIRGADTKLLNVKEELGEEEEFLGEENEQQFHRRDRVSRSQWFRYFCHIRGLNYNWRDSHWLWDWRTLAQLYTITFNNRMEAQKVQFMKQLQGRRRLVRPSTLINWLKALRNNKGLEGEIGRIYMTDENFRGSRQYYQREYANCMTICREIGKPDLLITFTMDPDCAELQEMLSVDANDNRQQWYDRPDIVCRLFIDKLKEMHKDLTQREVMGPVRGWFYSLEHQKRGLPHVHFALILDWDRMRSNGTINSPEEYIEQYISAEIPENPSGRSAEVIRQRELYKTVTTKNIHTCSAQRCLADGKCTKRFPKPFSYANVYSENQYPRYRRRPPAPSDKEAQQHSEKWGRYIQYPDKKGKLITKDNRHVVPYNAFLSAKYKSHINTEFVAGDGCTKYLCKYVMKGADMAFIEVQATGVQQKKVDYDEFHQVRLARYITSMEAYLSLWGSALVQRSHVVDELDVHGPHGQRIAVEQGFKDEEEDRNKICEAAQREEERRETGEERVSQLTAYFNYNQQHQALGLTYATCYKKLRYDRTKKQWQAYVAENRAGHKLCRLKTVSPSDRELLAIRLLLLVVADPTGWEALQTFEGKVHPTFVEAARARGLLTDQDLWMKTIVDAFKTKKSIRQRIRWLAVFFATANLSNPTEILNKVLEDPSKWLVKTSIANASPHEQQQYVLRAMEWFLLANGVQPDSEERPDGTFQTACEHIGLPRPEGVVLDKDTFMKLAFFRDDVINDNLPDELKAEGQQRFRSMQQRYLEKYTEGPQPNGEQQTLIDTVLKALQDARAVIDGQQDAFTSDIPRLFMVTGEGGAGKTFTYNKIIARAKANGFHFLPMATTGIAAELLYEGQTVHKRLCRAKHVDSSMAPNVDAESNFAHMLRNIHGMIIDEISMQHRDVLEYVDRLLRSVAPPRLRETPFAGKVLLIGGDWKQLAPVIPGGYDKHQLDASVKMSTLFPNFSTIRLRANHRLRAGQENYRAFLQRVGCGTINDGEHRVKVPAKMVLQSRDALLDFVFPRELLENPLDNWKELSERAILAPLNSETLKLNEIIMNRLNTDDRVYQAITTPVVDETGQNDMENAVADINHENLARLTPSGVPQHHLRVRVGAVMMIIVNVSVEEGLCNGTRVQVLELFDNIIRCKILTGTHVGNEHDLHAARFVFGGDPKATHEGPFKCERIQFPLRPGSVMTINKSQGQTLSKVGVLLDTASCFSHGQLYVALSRARSDDSIRVCTLHRDRRVKNVVMKELLDKDDIESAGASLPEDPNDPFPRLPPGNSDSDEEMPKENPADPMFKTPTPRTRLQPSLSTPVQLDTSVAKQHLSKINVVKGDITKQHIFMIVNGANNSLVKGRGIDDAIHRECDPERGRLEQQLADITTAAGGQLPDGTVVETPAFGKLAGNVQLIAHAVCPKVSTTVTDAHKKALAACYVNSLNLLCKAKMGETTCKERSIAFPCISTGTFNFPRADAAHIAFSAILNWLGNETQSAELIEEIRLVAFNDEDVKLYKELWERIKRQISGQRRRSSAQGSQASPISEPPQFGQPMQLSQTSPLNRRPILKNNKGGGDCLFRALATSIFGEDIEEKALHLRQHMFALLLTMVGNENCYPRASFDTHEAFVEQLRMYLLELDGSNTFQQYAQLMSTRGTWGQLNDCILAAMLLQRPVVMLRPSELSVQEAAALRPGHNDPLHRQRIDVYFPDGQMMTMDRDFATHHLGDLQDFMIREPGNVVERQVTNPIAVWYNGYNHYQTVIFTPSDHITTLGAETINAEQLSIPEQLQPQEVVPMEIETQAAAVSQESLPSTSASLEVIEPPAAGAPEVRNLLPSGTPGVESLLPTVRTANVQGDGACFFRSIVQSVCGVDDVQLATNLRLHMFGLLQRILEDQTCYPRGHFGNYADFIQSISDLILVADENFNNYIEQRIDPFNWAKIHDAVFAALLLQRPIVVVNPALYQEITRERPTLHDTSYVQNLNVYFPDGHHLRMRRDVPLEQLGHFTARDRRNRERQVVNPVVIWYNGHDHFQTLSFTPPVPNAAEGSEAITSLELQIPRQLLEEAEEPMEIEVLPQPQVVLPSVSSILEEERAAAEIERSFESYDEVFLDETFQQMQLCKWCDGVVIPPAAAATADNEMRQQSEWDGFIDLRCCGHFHRRCFNHWNQTPASFEIKRLHEYEDEDDNCPNCHQRVGSTPHGTSDPTSTSTKSSESAAQKEQDTTLLSTVGSSVEFSFNAHGPCHATDQRLSTSTVSSVQQTVRMPALEPTSPDSSRHASTESAGSASSSEDSILRRAAALAIQMNEQRSVQFRLALESAQQQLQQHLQANVARNLGCKNLLLAEVKRLAKLETGSKAVKEASSRLETEQQNVEATNALIHAAVDQQRRQQLLQQFSEQMRRDAVQSKQTHLVNIGVASATKAAQDLFNIILRFLTLWYNMLRVDASSASNDQLILWLRNAPELHDQLRSLQEAWEIAAEKLEKKKQRAKTRFRLRGSNPFSPTDLKWMLKETVRALRPNQKKVARTTDSMFTSLFAALRDKHQTVTHKIVQRQRTDSTASTQSSALQARTRKRGSAHPSRTPATITSPSRSTAKRTDHHAVSGPGQKVQKLTAGPKEQQRNIVAAAAEKRLREQNAIVCEQNRREEELRPKPRQKLAEERIEICLQHVEHLCKQHVKRLRNLPVRNLTWDREAAIEREMTSQGQQLRKKLQHILRRAHAAGNLNCFENDLRDEVAVRQLADDIITSSIFEVDAQYQEVVNQQNAIIREQKRREEEQRAKYMYDYKGLNDEEDIEVDVQAAWDSITDGAIARELQQQLVVGENERLKQREEEEAWMAYRPEPIEELERLARIDAYGFDPRTEQPVPARLEDQRDLLQQVGVAQAEPEALRAQEHIEQQLQFASGDYVEEVEVAGKKGEDKGPTPHPHFASLGYDILTPRREQILHRNEPNCSICREPFRVGDLVTRLHPDAFVKHIFHTICLRRWLTTSRTCPMCRKDVQIEQIIPPNHEHLNAFNEYVAREQQQPNATMRLRDNEFVSRAWHLYEQLRQPQRDAYGSQIGRGLEPEAAFRQVMGFINRGRFDMFGGEQLIWDASDPRNDAAAGTHICKHILQDKLNEDRRKK